MTRYTSEMGEIREKVRLTNLADTLVAPRAGKRRRKPRSVEVEAVVDTGAIMSVIPIHVAQKLGVEVRTRRMARYADGRTEDIGVTNPILFEVLRFWEQRVLCGLIFGCHGRLEVICLLERLALTYAAHGQHPKSRRVIQVDMESQASFFCQDELVERHAIY